MTNEPPPGWAIDTHSTPNPILTYEGCSVIQDEQAHEVLAAFRRAVAVAVAKRLLADDYIDWPQAGGPNECKHGYAKGVPCRECDREAWAAFIQTEQA